MEIIFNQEGSNRISITLVLRRLSRVLPPLYVVSLRHLVKFPSKNNLFPCKKSSRKIIENVKIILSKLNCLKICLCPFIKITLPHLLEPLRKTHQGVHLCPSSVTRKPLIKRQFKLPSEHEEVRQQVPSEVLRDYLT
jgi:hypothetical protein